MASILEKLKGVVESARGYFDNEREFTRFEGDVEVTPEQLKGYETQVVGIDATEYPNLPLNNETYECPIGAVEPFPIGDSKSGFAVGVRFVLTGPEGRPDNPIRVFFGGGSRKKYKTVGECNQAISKGEDVVKFSERALKRAVATEMSQREISDRLSTEYHDKMAP